MYIPPHYAAPSPRAIVAEFPFAQLVSAGPDGILATRIPIYFETDAADENRLVGHMARANPHAPALRTGDPALAIFNGPQAYISAGWYREQPAVPTWNYLSAQVRGTLEAIDDIDAQIAILKRALAMAERDHEPRWTYEQTPREWLDRLLPHIRSFRISITSMEGTAKLNQPRSPEERGRICDALERRGYADDIDIARRMRALDQK